jgi:hypothetical protein
MICGKRLSGGRTCIHVKGHYVRHGATWQVGDARYLDIDGHLLDMATGEVIGFVVDDTSRVIAEIAAERAPDGRHPADPAERQRKARRVLELYGWHIPDKPATCYAVPPKGYDWYFEGDHAAYGTDSNGHSVEFDFATGKLRRMYSLNDKRRAVAYAKRYGAAKAAKKYDIPAATVRVWTRRSQSSTTLTA